MKKMLILSILFLSTIGVAQPIVYVINALDDQVLAFEPTGNEQGTFTLVLDGLENPQDIAVDEEQNIIYVSDPNLEKIVMVSESGVEDLVTNTAAFDLELFDNNTKLLWTSGEDLILQYDFVTGQIDTIYEYTAIAGILYGLAIAPDGTIFFSDSQNEELLKTDLQGSTAQVLFSEIGDIWDIAVHPESERIYFTNESEELVQSSDFDGNDLQTIIEDAGSVRGLDIDMEADKLYWASEFTGFEPDRLHRANLDGSDFENLIILEPFDGFSFFGLELGSSIITDTEELEPGEMELSFYPNPFIDFIQIDYVNTGTFLQEFQINIISLEGKLLHSEKVIGFPHRLEIAHLPVGMFVLEMSADGQALQTFQIVKQ